MNQVTPRWLLVQWQLRTRVNLSQSAISEFLAGPEVGELCQFPEAALRRAADSATHRSPQGNELSLTGWLTVARQISTTAKSAKRAAASQPAKPAVQKSPKTPRTAPKPARASLLGTSTSSPVGVDGAVRLRSLLEGVPVDGEWAESWLTDPRVHELGHYKEGALLRAARSVLDAGEGLHPESWLTAVRHQARIAGITGSSVLDGRDARFDPRVNGPLRSLRGISTQNYSDDT